MSTTAKVTTLLLAVIGLVLATLVGRVYRSVLEYAAQPSCQSNMHSLAQAITTYAADNDGKLPARPWSEVVTYKRCPNDRSPDGPSYALHHRWLRDPLVMGEDAVHLILLYESGPEPFAYRHYDGMNVGFVDGHVKFYKEIDLTPAQITIGKR